MTRKIIDIVLKSVFASAVIFAILAASYFSFTDNSTFNHAISGMEFARDFTFPKANEASFTGPIKWDKSSWMFDTFLYAETYLFRNYKSMRFIKFGVMMFTAIFLFLASFKKQKGKYLSITMPIALLGMAILDFYTAVSPYMTAPFFTAYFIFVLEQEPSKKNALVYYTLPLAAFFWANFSTTAAAAAVLTAIYTLYYIFDAYEVVEKREKYNSPAILIAFAGVALATLLSPAYTKIYTEPVTNFSMGIAALKETFTTPGFSPLHFILISLYVIIYIAMIIFNEKSSDVGRKSELIKDFFILIVLLLACAANMAYEPVFVAATLPTVMYYASLIFRWNFVWPRKWTENDLASMKIVLYTLMILALSGYGAYKFLVPVNPLYPDGALAYIKAEKPPQHLFTTIEWGPFICFYAPEYKLMYDGNVARQNDVKREYDILIKNQLDPLPIIQKNSIGSVLLKHGNPLAEKLHSEGFKTAYFDSQSIILVDPSKTTEYMKYIDPENDANFYDKDKYAEAVAELTDYAQRYPSVAAHLLLARLLGEKDEKKEETYLENTISDFPQEYPLYNLMGRMYYDIGDYSSAMDIWEQSKQKDVKINMLYKDAQKRENMEENE